MPINRSLPIEKHIVIDSCREKKFSLKNLLTRQKRENYIRDGLKGAYVKGRFQLINSNPPVIIDAAHNIAGIEVLKEAVKKML